MSERANYSRKAMEQWGQVLPAIKLEWMRNRLTRAHLGLGLAIKFHSPDVTQLFADKELRGLRGGVPLRLPFPVIAIEYVAQRSEQGPGLSQCPKRIALAMQESADTVVVTSIAFFEELREWLVVGTCRMHGAPEVTHDGLACVTVQPLVSDEKEPIPLSKDLNDEVFAVLGMLNLLSCTNVAIEDLPAPTRLNRKALRNGALPFDSYKVLVLRAPRESGREAQTSVGRSPREHLRRGHIRRLHSGARVWVNATIVAAGASGRVLKGYQLQERA